MALKRCRYLEAAADKRLSRASAYRCLAPDPVQPEMPASITGYYRFKWPPERAYVCVDDHCEKCPMYEKAAPR